MSSIKDKISRARMPERPYQLCLRGDLDQRHRDLKAQIAEARRAGATSLAGPDLGDMAEQLEALRMEMEAESIQITFRAMSKRNWSQLLAEHPPRPDNPREMMMGYAPTSFYAAAIPASQVGDGPDAEDWRTLIGDETTEGLLTDGQWDELTDLIYALNRQAVSVPFSERP